MYSKSRLENLSKKEIYGLIFLSFLLVRLLFVFVLKSYFPQLEVFPDSERYDILSSQILEGNYSLDCGLFLVAPVYPFFLALMKVIFGSYWNFATPAIQIFLSCLSGIYFYKLAKLLFESKQVIFLGVIGYCIYPFTMWYVHSISQETIYQTFLIFSIYHLVFGIKESDQKHLTFSAILFSICFLTKSIILFYSPFIALMIYWYFKGSWRQKLKMVFIYTLICLAFTLPNGIYNWETHGVYTFSSGGIGFFYSYSNNENASKAVGLYKYEKGLNHFDYTYGQPFELEPDEKLNYYSPKERNQAYLKEGIKWVTNNKKKWFLLSLTKLQQFLIPGFNIVYHPFDKWILSFLVGLPVFFFGYLGLINAIRIDFKLHSWMFFLFLSMLIFSIIFSNQGRFRSVTMEGFYIMYAAYGWSFILERIQRKRNEN